MGYWYLFGLEKEPFSTSPDPAFFFRSRQHRAGLANILSELRLKRGLSVILGDIGTGKTTLARKLIHMMSERSGFIFHMVMNPAYRSEEQFLEALVRRLNIVLRHPSPSLVDYGEALEFYLYQKGIKENKTVVLVIDEAHKLNQASLEALRILLNYETNETKLLQLVLLGQMELLPILEGMPNLNDRISLQHILQPFDLEETHEMIEFRLREAGYKSRVPLFTDRAIEEIHGATAGYPRRIALLCHKALRMAVMKERNAVNREIIQELLDLQQKDPWKKTTILQKSGS